MSMPKSDSAESKRELLGRFVGSAHQHDAELADFWRQRSAAEHAIAGAQISDMAAQMSAQTGFGKDPDEMFPILSTLERQRGRSRQ